METIDAVSRVKLHRDMNAAVSTLRDLCLLLDLEACRESLVKIRNFLGREIDRVPCEQPKLGIGRYASETPREREEPPTKPV